VRSVAAWRAGYGVEVLAAAPQWQRLIVLTPVFVIGAGLLIGIFMVLGRALAANVRESGHPRLFYVGLVALAGVIGLLTYLGVQLPRE
jgi:hypothetical protein